MGDYTNIEKEVKALADTIWEMALNVWEFAELGYEEFKSSAYECAALEKCGFTISDRGIGGLDHFDPGPRHRARRLNPDADRSHRGNVL